MSYAHAPITRAGNLILRNKQSGIHKVYTGISLFGIQLDDEMLLDREVDVVSFRQGNYLPVSVATSNSNHFGRPLPPSSLSVLKYS